MVFLQKDRVVKTDSVIGAATDFYRVFFEQAQAGSRFTCIANPCTRSLNLFDKTTDHCRNAAEPAEEIQRSAFSGKNCARFSFQVKENRSFADQIAVVNAKLNLHVRVEGAKNSFGHWKPRADEVLASQNARLADCARRNRRQNGRVSGANVFFQSHLDEPLNVFRIPIHWNASPRA